MCMIDSVDEMYDVSSTKRVRARKPAHCGECGRSIAIGDEYQRTSGLYDGHWDVNRVCVACDDGPCRWLVEHCGGYLFGGVAEDLEDHWQERHDLGLDGEGVLRLGRLIIEMARRRGERKALR